MWAESKSGVFKFFNLLYVFFKFSKCLLCIHVWFSKLFIVFTIKSWKRRRWSVFWHLSLQLQRSVPGTLSFLQLHQLLLQSPLQLQDTNLTSPFGAIFLWRLTYIKIPFLFISQPWKRWLTVIIIDKLADYHTTNVQPACFKCWRNAPGDDWGLFVFKLNILYRK